MMFPPLTYYSVQLDTVDLVVVCFFFFLHIYIYICMWGESIVCCTELGRVRC